MDSQEKNERFNHSLNELINILFSFAFGFGLTKLECVIKPTFNLASFAPMLIGYLIILLSWWGYNKAIIKGGMEKYANYIIDILLLVSYWLLFVAYDHFAFFSFVVAAIYILYTVWSIFRAVGTCDNDQKKSRIKAIIRNAVFAGVFTAIAVLVCTLHINQGKEVFYYLILCAILLLNIIYRIIAYANNREKVE